MFFSNKQSIYLSIYLLDSGTGDVLDPGAHKILNSGTVVPELLDSREVAHKLLNSGAVALKLLDSGTGTLLDSGTGALLLDPGLL